MKNLKSIAGAMILAAFLASNAFAKSGTISTTRTGTISTTKSGTISTTRNGTISTTRGGTISTTRAGVISSPDSWMLRTGLVSLILEVW